MREWMSEIKHQPEYVQFQSKPNSPCITVIHTFKELFFDSCLSKYSVKCRNFFARLADTGDF